MIAVIDTETTGLDSTNGSIVELAVVTIPGFDSFSTIVKPSHPIELEALATHHISEIEASDGAPVEDALVASMIRSADFIAAHNAAFDQGFLKIDKPTICTWRCARQLWPDAPSHKNQVLRYYLGLNEEIHHGAEGRMIMQLPPHRALPDAWVTAHILHLMLRNPGQPNVRTPEELVEMTKQLILIKNCGFGMHRGKPWAEVPNSYLAWIMKEQRNKPGSFDEDTIYTAKHYLGLV